MEFTHFLITRFNLRNFPKSSNNTDFDTWASWTRERIDLFKKYCLPSILNQTEKNFTWLIFFDSDTPEEFEDFVHDLEKYSFIQICYSEGSKGFYDNYINEIESRVKGNSPWLITSQLDNDDVLHKQAIEVIQKNFIGKSKYMISLASGYVLDVNRNVLAHYFYPMGPFISIVEAVGSDIVGIFENPHTQWPQLKLKVFTEFYLKFFNEEKRQTRFILDKPLWIQIVHGKNVSNSFYRGLPVTKPNNLSEFSLNTLPDKISLLELPKFWNYVYWKRYFKSWIVKLVAD